MIFSSVLACLEVNVPDVERGGGGVLHSPRLVGQRGEQPEEAVTRLAPLDGDGGGGVGVELDGPVCVGTEAGPGGQLVYQVLQLLLLLGSSLYLT